MVATVVISSTAFLAADLTYLCTDIMPLEVEMALEVKVKAGVTFGTQFEFSFITSIFKKSYVGSRRLFIMASASSSHL
jgi:hypothetical protein